MNQTPSAFDADYLHELARAQEDAQARLVSAFSARLRIALRARLRSPQAVEDAYQETLLRIFAYFRSGKTLRTASSLPAFVESVCINVALENGRAGRRHDQIPENLPDPIDNAADPEGRVLAEERKRLVRSTLGVLRERDQNVLRRLFLEEEDRVTLCREYNISERHLRLLVHRARMRFRRVIDKSSALRRPEGRHRHAA